MKKHLPSWTTRMARLCVFPVTWIAGVVAAMSPAAQQAAQAQVVPVSGGTGTTVTESGGQFEIEGGTQAGGNLFHEFEQFDLDAAQTANFTSDSDVFNIVGQISEANPSYIDGTVQVSGSDANLYLINPSGVLFGHDAQLSLSGSFTATTADQVEFEGEVLNVLERGTDYSSFTGDASAFHFTETSASAVVNQGNLAVDSGESISLIGGNVANTGTLSAPGGEIGLVAVGGESTVRYGIPGSLLSIEVAEGVAPDGNGFAVTDLPALLTGSSIPVANSLSLQPNGSYKLGPIQIEAEEVSVMGELSTRSTAGDGGAIALLGRSIDTVNAVIDASGDNGGDIYIGGAIDDQSALPTSDILLITPRSVFRAEGLNGAGGNIAVKSTLRGTVSGDFSAEGTTLGGRVEMSSPRINLNQNLSVEASGQTEGGQWLLELGEIDLGRGISGFNHLDLSVIESTLDSGTDVEIVTTAGTGGNGDISLSDSVDQQGGGRANLTLTGRQFINNGSTIDLSSTGQLTFGINQVNTETTSDSESIENAIATIGNVNGRRLVSLGAGNYDFADVVVLSTEVEIEGAGAENTALRAITTDNKVFRINSGVNATVREATFTTFGLGEHDAGGGIRNNGNLTVENSHFVDNRAFQNGGAIDSYDGGVLTISDSEFTNNRSATNGSGGAINIASSSGMSQISNTIFTNNQSFINGGALRVNNAALRVDDQTSFVGNTAIDGGAVAISGAGEATFDDVTFTGNSAESGGGLIAWGGALTTLDNTTFINNHATDGDGGAIRGLNSTINISNSTGAVDGSLFAGNTATRHGGGLFIGGAAGNATVESTTFRANQSMANGGGAQVGAGSRLTVNRSTFEENQAISGGGLANQGEVVLTNTTFSGNLASQQGGAIATTTADATLSLRNSTLTLNHADAEGGGIAEIGTQATRLANTLVASNTSTIASDVRGAFQDDGGNLIAVVDGATGFTNSTLIGTTGNAIAAQLMPLADNGGLTKTHLLQGNSLAVDAGIATSVPAVDQRGGDRIVGTAVDIGAVELTESEQPAIPIDTPIDTAIASPLQPNLLNLDPTISTTVFSRLDTLLANRIVQTLSEADSSIRRLERSFSRNFEDYWDLSAGPDTSFSDVQAILQRAQEEYKVNSAVIYAEFIPADPVEEEESTILQIDPVTADDDRLNLSVVLPEGELVSYQLPVTRKEAVRQVRYFRSAVSDPEDARSYQPLGQQLYQWLLAPIEDDLAAQNIQNLMYALDDGLRTSPITAMRDYNGFSLERYGISVVPSIGLMQADFPVGVRRATVAMGVSEFDSQSPLPAVPIELAVVDQFVPVSQTVLNEKTTLGEIRRVQALEQPGVLHLATHASFDQRSPEDSMIHLWNEPLSMKEFSTLDWERSDLELLILSACSTALGSRNSELGFAGLAAASGVDATVGSLWEVSDVGTLALMSEFYAQLEETDLRFEALRQAQLALLNGDTRIEDGNLVTSHGEVALPDEWNLPESATLDHPFFWSAFTMVGNPW